MEHAFCYRSGEVLFGKTVPQGSLVVMLNINEEQKEKLIANCRLAYDNKTLLVPGIPEAEDDDEAYQAYIDFTLLLEQKYGFGRISRETAEAYEIFEGKR